MDYAAFRKVDVIQGAGVGGGSLHYFNVNLPADPRIFEDRRWPAALTRAALDPFYGAALEMLESRPLRPPPGRDSLPRRSVAFLAAGRKAGLNPEAVAIAVHTDMARLNPATGLDQSPCTYCGNCLYGCDIGAKNTLDTNYLAIAERRHGAEILPLHVVDNIVGSPGGGYDVGFRRLDPFDAGREGMPGTLHGTTVVVSAGALGSTGLLLSCRDRHRSLPDLPAALGRQFSTNGEFLFAFAHDTDRRCDPGVGPPITARVSVSTPAHLITVEDLGLPDSLLWYLEGALPPSRGRLGRSAALLAAYAKRTLGLGGPTSRLSVQLDALVDGGRTTRAIPFLGMGTDSSDGRVTLRGDGIDIEWSVARNRGLYREMTKVMGQLSQGAGGEFTTSFLYRWPMRKVLTAHPLGGCPMGDDPATSVVDDHGEVWTYPGLFVIDGSMVPTALAVNPSLTIAALAERSAAWMVHAAAP